jgi:hypothetical protein
MGSDGMIPNSASMSQDAALRSEQITSGTISYQSSEKLDRTNIRD